MLSSFLRNRPNEGFVEQLKLFAKMGNRVDANHPEFRIYRFNHMADQRARTYRVGYSHVKLHQSQIQKQYSAQL